MRVRLSMFSVSSATFIRCYYQDTISKRNYFRGKACSKNSCLRRWRRGGGEGGCRGLLHYVDLYGDVPLDRVWFLSSLS